MDILKILAKLPAGYAEDVAGLYRGMDLRRYF